jgi:hypothetical protein
MATVSRRNGRCLYKSKCKYDLGPLTCDLPHLLGVTCDLTAGTVGAPLVSWAVLGCAEPSSLPGKMVLGIRRPRAPPP